MSAGVRFVNTVEGTADMIVIGTDTHKRTHTCGAVDSLTAAARGELTVPARNGSFGKLLRWARALDPERVWAIEDCRHVSGARELVRQITARTTRIRELEAELAALVESYAPQLLAERGCGPLTAAKLIGEIAGAGRFASDAKLARTGGAAPIPASSGNTNRHRLDRGGNRQLNCALHRLAVNKGTWDPDAAAYLARKQAEGKSRKEALRFSSATSPAASGN